MSIMILHIKKHISLDQYFSTFATIRTCTDGKNSSANGKSGVNELQMRIISMNMLLLAIFIFYFESADRILCSKLVLTNLQKVEKH